MSVVSLFFLGLFYVCLLFSLCVLLVVGVKLIYSHVKSIFAPPSAIPIKQPTAVKSTKPKRKPKTFRSIEINPEEVDRIYVKKVS
ncbi:MAG: hypothetical protein IJC07_03325 [Clostridia bacterium]|nr:hypothetical protein [Clostridia bacterium]